MASTFDGTVTVDEVRTALGDVPNDQISAGTIQQKISEATVFVESRATDGATVEQKEIAIRRIAARDAFLATPPTESESEADVSKSVNVDAYIQQLRDRANDAIEDIEDPVGGDSQSIGFEVF